MRRARAASTLALANALWLAAGCGILTPFEASPAADADADADLDIPADADTDSGDADRRRPDADGRSGPGPLVLVMERIGAVAEATCDVDEDGDLDSVLAELGEDAGAFADILSALLNSGAGPGIRLVVHVQEVEDRAAPETDGDGTTAAAYAGLDIDAPNDPRDDFSGQEPFYAASEFLDPCGEPLLRIEDVRISDGEVSVSAGLLALVAAGFLIPFHVVAMEGDIEPHGESAVLYPCGYATVADLGRVPLPPLLPGLAGLSLLEAMVWGGAALGRDSVPGLQPDVDWDGDGLELLEVDDEGHIVRCIDGDRTVIEGAECWSDPRMADGFSLTLELRGVAARFGGRQPGWALGRESECDDWPLSSSFFDTALTEGQGCALLDEPCDPTTFDPCCDSSHRCSGEDGISYRCYTTCRPTEGDCSVGHRCVPLPFEDGGVCVRSTP